MSGSAPAGGPVDALLAVALAAAQRFAHERGLDARVVDHWVRYVEVAQSDGRLLKRISIIPVGAGKLAVEAAVIEAEGRVATPVPAGMWWSTEIGEAEVQDAGAMVDLGRLLEAAWQKLSPFDLEELKKYHGSLLRHVSECIDPVLESFAGSNGGAVSKENWRLRLVTWPKRRPGHRLVIQLSPRDGILLSCETAQRSGLLRLRHWVSCPEFPERRIPDWGDVDVLTSALEDARAACG